MSHGGMPALVVVHYGQEVRDVVLYARCLHPFHRYLGPNSRSIVPTELLM